VLSVTNAAGIDNTPLPTSDQWKTVEIMVCSLANPGSVPTHRSLPELVDIPRYTARPRCAGKVIITVSTRSTYAKLTNLYNLYCKLRNILNTNTNPNPNPILNLHICRVVLGLSGIFVPG